MYEHRNFADLYDDGGSSFQGITFRQCKFLSCGLSLTLDPKLRSVVRDVHLQDCEFQGCGCGAAVLEDVTVSGLKTNGLFQCFGAVFKHVVLRGKIERIMLSKTVAPGRASKQQQRTLDLANAEYYRDVDWAVDIRHAEFEECDIRGIPASLFLPDGETQLVVTRAKAAEGTWRRLDLSSTHWPGILDLFLQSGDPDTILIAPKQSKNFKRLLLGLQALRAAGVAEAPPVETGRGDSGHRAQP